MKIKFLLVTAVLVTAILGFGFAVSAQTPQNQSDVGSSSIQAMIVQLQAQIASLMAQIQALQTQQNGTQQWCHTFNTNLGFINSGSPEVSNLYGALIKEGIVEGVPSENIRTDYGEETASYVIKFQAKYGIMQSGYVGPLTRAKLNTLYGCAVNPICTPNWQCQWGVCANGSQSKVPVDSNNCGQQASSSLLAACSRQVENCAPSSTTQPTVTLTAAGGATGPMVQVQSGASIDLRWTSVNANNGCSISSTPNDSSIAVTNHLPANSTITVRPITSTTYTVTCYYVDSNYQTTQGSNSITLQVASPTAQPSIKVISPNGGEILPFGMPQVSWTSSGVTNANIYLQFPDGATCFIKTVPASQGSDIITILNGFQCPNISRTISAGQYKIFIIGDSDSGPRDFSDNYFNFSTANEGSFSNVSYACYDGSTFNEGGPTSCKPSSLWQSYANQACQNKCSTVTGKCGLNTFSVSNQCSSTQSSITVTSPNGGETLTAGNNILVRWTASGAESFPGANIQLVNSNGSTVSSVNVNPASGSWTTDSLKTTDVPIGQYKIKACLSGNIDICDTSDNYFTIVVPTTATPLVDLKANNSDGPITIIPGDSLSLSWTVSNASSCQSNWAGVLSVVGGNGTSTLNSSSSSGTQTYTITCTNSGGGYATDSVIVNFSSITVSSPNGGETWTQGNTYTIRWNSSNLPTNSTYNVLLFKDDVAYTQIAGNYANNWLSWTIPTSLSTLSGDKFKIRVALYTGTNNSIVDLSDNYFTIAVPGSIVCNPGQKIGDVNGDGSITQADADLVLQMASQTIPTPSNICCIDAKQDGVVSSADAAYILRIISGTYQSPGVCPTTTSMNVSQSSLASISDALKIITQKIQSLLGY